jgi:hypothetical protein
MGSGHFISPIARCLNLRRVLSTVQFLVLADDSAGLDFGIDGETARPSLNHKLHWDKIFQQRYRQLHSGKSTLLVRADG